MNIVLFEYPKSAAFGRVLPKSKIYLHAKPRTALKDLFVRQVEQIVWQYKLAPETINLKQSRAVPEIQVFSISLRAGELKDEVLRCIDKAIPFPIIFELSTEGKVKAVAAFKRASESDGSKLVVSDYFASPWLPKDTPRSPLPVVGNLEGLYAQLLSPLMPFQSRSGESLQARVQRMDMIHSKQREIGQCEGRLRKERQFNRKVEINAELRSLKEELADLTSL